MVTSPATVAVTRRKVIELLAGDLGFNTTARDSHPLHALHPFAARFPYGLAGYFVNGLSTPGDTVLDPMCGSGATLLEGWLAHRSVIGVDLDPLARRQSMARTTALDPAVVRQAGESALNRAANLYAGLARPADPLSAVRNQMDAATLRFIDYWFLPETQKELAALALAVRSEPDDSLRNLLQVILSSTIVTKSGGVSRARDLAHTRPHRVDDKTPRRPLRLFQTLLNRAVDAYAAVDSTTVGVSAVVAGDSRRLPLGGETVDLIVTSPPYANALDYMRAHKFSLAWLGESVPRLSRLRSRYIGAERHANIGSSAGLPASVQAITAELAVIDAARARVLARYFSDMAGAIGEMARVLRPGSATVMVVGPSVMRGVLIPTHDCLADIAGQAGLEVIGVVPRPIDRDRRMMPARNGNQRNDPSGIERRMHTEYVIGALKATTR